MVVLAQWKKNPEKAAAIVQALLGAHCTQYGDLCALHLLKAAAQAEGRLTPLTDHCDTRPKSGARVESSSASPLTSPASFACVSRSSLSSSVFLWRNFTDSAEVTMAKSSIVLGFFGNDAQLGVVGFSTFKKPTAVDVGVTSPYCNSWSAEHGYTIHRLEEFKLRKYADDLKSAPHLQFVPFIVSTLAPTVHLERGRAHLCHF